MKSRGLSTIGGIALAMMLVGAPTGVATATPEQSDAPRVEIIGADTCVDAHTRLDSCFNIGGPENWTEYQIGTNRFLLAYNSLRKCIATDGAYLFFVYCTPDDATQQWERINTTSLGTDYRNISHTDVCIGTRSTQE
jgi:hypothetical protein